MKKRIFFILSAVWLLAACSGLPPQAPGAAHLRAEDAPPASAATADIPPPVKNSAVLPPLAPTPKTEVYSVVVNKVDVSDLLFALARDAKMQVDLKPGISGSVTLNAINQTLPQLLERIARQVDLRWELKGAVLFVEPDSPYLHTYPIDYVNMSRDVAITSFITPQVSSAAGAGAAASGNASVTKIEDVSKNQFWKTLEQNVKDILRETDKILPEGSSETVIEGQSDNNALASAASASTGSASVSAGRTTAQSSGQNAIAQNALAAKRNDRQSIKTSTVREAASVIINPESGIVTVRATSRQHEKIQEFLDAVIGSARRQVLIEATIAEVQLSRNYQQGIDWQILASGGKGFNFTQAVANSGAQTTLGGVGAQLPAGTLPTQSTSAGNTVGSLLTLGYKSANFAAAVKLLESFGNVKVLSSPKISVLNNQTAVINVGNQAVYFKVTCTSTASNTAGSNPSIACDTTPQTAAVGLLMSVTPQISADGSVLLNVRPSTSRITGYRNDPNPSIPAGISNQVPEIERRDMESVLRVTDGETAVLGGLMQDSIDYKDDTVPGLGSIPVIGNLFSYKNQTNTKTELVIFLRPTLIKDASVNGDFRRLRANLPGQNFLKPDWGPSGVRIDADAAP